MLQPMPYSGLFPPEEEEYHPTAVSRTMFVDTVDGEVAGTIMEHLEASDAPVRVVQLRVLGGASARVPVEATAYAHRQRRIMVNVAAFYDGPDDKPRRQEWVDGLAAAIRQGDGVYVNFLSDEGPERVREAYPGPTWDRLVEVKRRYDPGNLFHRNQNIPPTNGQGDGEQPHRAAALGRPIRSSATPAGAPAVLERVGGIAHPAALLADGREEEDQEQDRRRPPQHTRLGERPAQRQHHPVGRHQDGRGQEHDRQVPALVADRAAVDHPAQQPPDPGHRSCRWTRITAAVSGHTAMRALTGR